MDACLSHLLDECGPQRVWTSLSVLRLRLHWHTLDLFHLSARCNEATQVLCPSVLPHYYSAWLYAALTDDDRARDEAEREADRLECDDLECADLAADLAAPLSVLPLRDKVCIFLRRASLVFLTSSGKSEVGRDLAVHRPAGGRSCLCMWLIRSIRMSWNLLCDASSR
mmetsp:Transcript_68530/g.100311  ORF Transcript_68530/g.100311 Transcript_68530/m.100311 type:complete len:168 (-) Transcript_68530:510-1013(-)